MRPGMDFWMRAKLVSAITDWIKRSGYELINLDIKTGDRVYDSKSYARISLTFYVPEEEQQ